jgi:hypothetical protein
MVAFQCLMIWKAISIKRGFPSLCVSFFLCFPKAVFLSSTNLLNTFVEHALYPATSS